MKLSLRVGGNKVNAAASLLGLEGCGSIARACELQAGVVAGKRVRVRGYEPPDFEAIYRLDQNCYPPGIAYSRYALGEFLSLPGARAWVAEDEEQLVAFIIARRATRRHGHIITLDVRQNRRRQGIGTTLLATAEDWLRDEGATLVRLETAVDNPAAVAFWEKTGYVTVGRLPRYYLGRVDALRMEKELGV